MGIASVFVQECKFEKHASVKGYNNPYQKLACFVLYLKVINTFLKNDMYL